MAITVTEKPESREYTENEAAELLYTIMGTADEADARDALKAEAPSTFNGLFRLPVTVTPRFIDSTNPDVCIWIGTVGYAPGTPLDPPQVGDSVFQFDTGGGTSHITQSKKTISKTAAVGDAPDYREAIGVTNDSVAGVDIVVPVYTWSETHYLATANVTNAYKGILFELTGSMNLDAFKGFTSGEVVFLGASGSQRGEEDWEISFKFSASKTETDIEIGKDSEGNPLITVPEKIGQDYLWIRYEDVEDTDANALVKQPVAAYVERVREIGDFSQLGIGV